MPLALPLLRLRSDEQLLALFRAGSDEAFGVLHDRYRQRLFAYVRQMLSSLSRQDAEDVMQDVFVRAYGALRADGRQMNVRAWLYRVAHNRCIDHLRRPTPPAAEIYELSRRPPEDPTETAQRREDLARLVDDIGRLPEQQRSALLMRELDGMSYADLADALDVTVPAVKSLLVRARVGLVHAAEARDADCAEIRRELLDAYDRGVKAPGRARRHLRTCSACTDYRTALRGIHRSFAALSPVTFGPLALGAQLLGIGGAGGGAAAGGTAAAGGGGALVAGGGLATATACKVAAVVCTAAITAGGAVEARHIAVRDAPRRAPAAAAPAPAAGATSTAAAAAAGSSAHPSLRVFHGPPAAEPVVRAPHGPHEQAVPVKGVIVPPAPGTTVPSGGVPSGDAAGPAIVDGRSAGGVQAPDEVATPPAVDESVTPAPPADAEPATEPSPAAAPGATAPGPTATDAAAAPSATAATATESPAPSPSPSPPPRR